MTSFRTKLHYHDALKPLTDQLGCMATKMLPHKYTRMFSAVCNSIFLDTMKKIDSKLINE